MIDKKSMRRWATILPSIVLAASAAYGQSSGTGAITGTVTDGTGASVPGASVTLTNQGTNQARSQTTGPDGTFRFNLIEIGRYNVRFSAAGFKTADVTGVVVNVAETPVVNRALEVGQQSEQVTVTAEAESIQTATSTLGTTVNERTITALPLTSRNFTQTLGLSAGVAVEVNNGAAFGRGTQNMSVNGASPTQNNFQLDGVSINNNAGQNASSDGGLYTGIVVPNPDALQEFKIQTSTYDASYGRNPGANVNVVTKSGTNEIHGTLFEYFRNEKLNATDFFQNRAGAAKQILRQNQFGFTLGAPIKKDKLFVFGSYQGTRQRNGVSGLGTTRGFLDPIPGNRESADFRARLGAAMCPQNYNGNGTLLPAFLTMQIACDGSNISPVALKLLQVKNTDGSYYIPGSTNGGRQFVTYSDPAKFREDQYLMNGDWLATSKHSVAMRFMYSHAPASFTRNGNLPGFSQSDFRTNLSSVLRVTSLVTNTVINQFRLSGQRIMYISKDSLPYTPQQIGLKPMIPEQTQPPFMILINNGFNIGGGLNPAFSPTNQLQIADQVSWTRGRHTFRAGGELERFHWPLVFGGLGRGLLLTGGLPDLLIGRAGCTDPSCSLANPGDTNGSPAIGTFLSCLFCVRSSPQGIIHGYRMFNANAFFQDDWKVNERLTVNLGVRWEYAGSLSDIYGNLTNVWPSELAKVPLPPSTAATANNPAGFTGYVVPSNYDPVAHGPLPAGIRQFGSTFPSLNGVPKKNLGPRIGLAWQPTGSGKLVVRAGFGIFYDRIGWDRFGHAVQEGKPYADTISFSGPAALPYSLANPFPERPLAFLPRFFNLAAPNHTAVGVSSNFNSPFYETFNTPLTRQYNLSLQYEFVPRWVLEVGFVGSSGINQSNYNHNYNAARLVCTALVSQNCVPGNVNGQTTNTASNAAARAKYLGFQNGGLQGAGWDAIYNYTSLQTTVRRQFSSGFSMQAAYTWSRSLGTTAFDATNNSGNVNHPDNMGNQYGQAVFSRPHRLIANYLYQLPMGRGNNSVFGRVFGNWAVAGVTTVQTGQPLTFIDTRGGSVFGLTGATAVQTQISTAQFAPGATHGSANSLGDLGSRLTRFWNPAAFSAPRVIGDDGSATDFGNAGVGTNRGPGQFNFDVTLTKDIQVMENRNLQFRWEMFNVFNHTQFSNPNMQVNGATFGQITTTSVSPRLMQLALKFTF